MIDMNEYMKNRYKERRAQAVTQLGAKCAICGSTDKLEFDHIDPSTKLFTVAKGSSFSNDRFWSEVSKCQLLCESCHSLKHHTAKRTHGTLSSYRYCRCSFCVAAKREANKRYKLNKTTPCS